MTQELSQFEHDSWTQMFKPHARSCGDCTLCCTLVPVEELGKKAGERCEHLCGNGCGIYENRPTSCRGWSCRWLLEIDTDGMQRPDSVHYVIDIAPDTVHVTDKKTGEETYIAAIQVWVDPRHRDAHKDTELRAYLARMCERYDTVAIIRYARGEGFVLFPPQLSPTGDWIETGHNHFPEDYQQRKEQHEHT